MNYVLTRRQGARDYAAYLDMYGSMYGDMSDPVQRAEVVRSLRNRDARMLAAVRREFWREVVAMSTLFIRDEIRVKRYQLDHCGAYRPWNIRNADIRTYRVLCRELKRRGESL